MERKAKNQKDPNLPYEAVDKFCQEQLENWKNLAEVQLEFAQLWQDYCNACFQRMSSAKSITDLYAIEAGLSTEYGSKFAECSRKAFESISGSQQELMESFANPESLFRSMFMDYPALWKNLASGIKGPEEENK
jgi:CRISPR/Cas system-associated endonuclease Cas1